jgi:acyl carrier protein
MVTDLDFRIVETEAGFSIGLIYSLNRYPPRADRQPARSNRRGVVLVDGRKYGRCCCRRDLIVPDPTARLAPRSVPMSRDPDMANHDYAERLRSIWFDVLDVESVEDEDSFLDLGGDSISGTLCLKQVRQIFDVDVPIDELLRQDMTFGKLVAGFDERMRGRDGNVAAS